MSRRRSLLVCLAEILSVIAGGGFAGRWFRK